MFASKLPLAILILCALVLGSGCGDDNDNLKPCPPKGLGVESASGTSCGSFSPNIKPGDKGYAAYEDCQDQITHWDEYACRQPQIATDQTGWWMPRWLIDDIGTNLSFPIFNYSTGRQDLVVSKVEFTGDKRCSFTYDHKNGMDKTVIEPGKDGAFLLALYKPTKPGEDHGHIRIHSNAQNFPVFVIPVCGRAYWKYKPGADSGASPAPDGGVGNTTFVCKDVPAKVEPCHKPK